MRFALCLAVLTFAALPAAAQDRDVPEEGARGFSLMEEGARLLLEGLRQEMEPAFEDLQGLAEGMAEDMGGAVDRLAGELGPLVVDLLERIDSLRYYDLPEVLPNGDIIIRRRPEAPPYVAPAPGDPIDL